jgi:hypothetical protein
MKRSDAEKDDVDAVKSVQRIAYALIFTIGSLTLVIKREDIITMWAFKSSTYRFLYCKLLCFCALQLL